MKVTCDGKDVANRVEPTNYFNYRGENKSTIIFFLKKWAALQLIIS